MGNDGMFIWAMESTLEPVQIYVVIDFLQGMMSIDGKNIKAKVERKKGENHPRCCICYEINLLLFNRTPHNQMWQ